MNVEVTNTESIREILTGKDDGCYTISILFDNDQVMVYAFHNLKDFIISYTNLINKYRSS